MNEELGKETADESEDILNLYIHPGLVVFQFKSALKYFNRELILRAECGDENLEHYLKDQFIVMGFEKIFFKKWGEIQQCLRKNRKVPNDDSKSPLKKQENLSTTYETTDDPGPSCSNAQDYKSTKIQSRNSPSKYDILFLDDESRSPLKRKGSPSPTKKTTVDGAGPSTVKSAAKEHCYKLIKRLRRNLSPIESDNDSSINLSITSPIKGSTKNNQNEKMMDVVDDCEVSKERKKGMCPADAATSKVDLVSLFWLISILQPPAASECKMIMDRDEFIWKINLEDIVLVFLNWGASLQSLGFDEFKYLPSLEDFTTEHISPNSPRTSSKESKYKSTFPNHSTVCIVLASIRERLPTECDMPVKRRVLLVRTLMYAAMDKQQRRNMTHFCITIRSVLDSFGNWDEDTADFLVNGLELKRMCPRNSVYVCSSVFNMMSERMSMVGLFGCYYILYHHFGIPAQQAFPALVDQLPHPPELLGRFTLKEIIIIAQLVHIALARYSTKTPPFSEDTVKKLYQWTIEVRDALKKYPYMFNLESGYVRERLSELSSECDRVMRMVYKSSLHSTFNMEQ